MKVLHHILGAIVILILLSITLVSFAEPGADEDDEAMRAEMHQRVQEHQQQMTQDLDLTPEQTRLWQAFNEAQHDFFESQRDDMEDASHHERLRHHRYMRQVHRIFYHELMAEAPDFAGAAAQIKQDYKGSDADSFNAMIDASTAFHQSLSLTQREKLLELMESHPPQGPGFHRH